MRPPRVPNNDFTSHRANQLISTTEQCFSWILHCVAFDFIDHFTYQNVSYQYSSSPKVPRLPQMMCSCYINVLGLNRLLEFTSPKWSSRIFGVKGTRVSCFLLRAVARKDSTSPQWSAENFFSTTERDLQIFDKTPVSGDRTSTQPYRRHKP